MNWKIIAILPFILTSLPHSALALSEYEVEVSHNDELFIINGEKFTARTYCFNVNEGDRVIFLEGSPNGACASAVIYDLNTRNKCEVWCE